ncbi:MAG: energy transducer TonB [Acidobacteriota bacterium]
MIEPKGLAARLAEELMRAASEFASDPSGFLRSLGPADAKDAKRRRLIYSGLAFALVAHVVFVAIAAIAGWHRIMEPPNEARPQITMLNPKLLVEPDTPSEKPLGKKDGGGGGGGQENPLPASKGHLPQSIPQSAVVDMRPSEIPEPTLAVAPTIQGLEGPPPPPGQIGDQNGKTADPSGGPGSGGGIGNNKGPGVGNGSGPGGGPGGKGGRGGGKPGSPDGSGIAEVNFSDLASVQNYTPFKWLRRPNPVVTPEAQESKVSGYVLLRATFYADGTISDIEVVTPVEYMTESAIDSLTRSKFQPATVNGRPVTVRRVLVQVKIH